ncbi:MAG: hypothetical protein AAF682_17945 [Planctomycetota bacterium]
MESAQSKQRVQTLKSATPEVDATPVSVQVTYESDGTLLIQVVEPTRRGPEAGDIVLGAGSWEVTFTITNPDDAVFAEGPLLLGPERPGPTDDFPTMFLVTQSSPSVLTMTVTIASGNIHTYRYMLRVEAEGELHVHDPKVINRGNPELIY